MLPAGGPFTGFSPLNPALTFAGSLVYDCVWRYMWMYLLAQATGGQCVLVQLQVLLFAVLEVHELPTTLRCSASGVQGRQAT
jgi:glycerol uptake facilitator-like aquaporin